LKLGGRKLSIKINGEVKVKGYFLILPLCLRRSFTFVGKITDRHKPKLSFTFLHFPLSLSLLFFQIDQPKVDNNIKLGGEEGTTETTTVNFDNDQTRREPTREKMYKVIFIKMYAVYFLFRQFKT